jgi:hypothetical protein
LIGILSRTEVWLEKSCGKLLYIYKVVQKNLQNQRSPRKKDDEVDDGDECRI